MQIGRLAVVIYLLALTPVVAVAGARDPIIGRGFSADQLYQFNGIDSINSLNGNLIATIPIGQTYKSNGSLQYQFTLTYNSNFWDYQYITAVGTNGPTWEQVYRWYFVGRMQDGLELASFNGAESYPAKHNNVGIGWMLTLGDMPHALVYLSPDGSEHQFWPADASAPVLYSRDSTYMRMVKISDTEREVHTPDGLRRRFDCVDQCTDQYNEQWLLDQISDPYGNVLWVERTAPKRPTTPGTWIWTLHEVATGKDGYADHRVDNVTTDVRSHRMIYSVAAERPWELRLDQIELAGFGGGNAVYRFVYNQTDIYRDRGSLWAADGLIVPFNANHKIDVSMLDHVDVPLTTSDPPGQHAEQWRFNYHACTTDELNSITMKDGHGNDFTYSMCQVGPRLTDLLYPTGGGVHYEYGSRNIPNKPCGAKAREGNGASTGVIKRQLLTNATTSDPNSPDLGKPIPDGNPWLYYSYSAPSTPQCQGGIKEVQSTIIDPLGNATVAFFSLYVPQTANEQAGLWDFNDYGLPLSKADVDQGRFASTETYQCTDLTQFDYSLPYFTLQDNYRRLVARNLQGGEAASCGAAIRRGYVAYEQDPGVCGDLTNADSSLCYQTNRRLQSRHTRYLDDGDNQSGFAFVATVNSQFDGLGHYRQADTSGDFNSRNGLASTPDSRSTFTDYNHGLSPDSFQTVNGGQVIYLPWVLDNYTQKSQQEPVGGGAVAKQLFFFDSRGFLLRQRVLALTSGTLTGTGPLAGNDVLTTFERVDNGNGSVTVTDRSFGGDMPSQHLCTTCTDLAALTSQDLPADSDYRLETRYHYGSPESKAYIPACGGDPVLSLGTATLDPNTGLPSAVLDASGAATHYQYDQAGRLTQESPDGLAATQYDYRAFSAGPSPSIPCGNALDIQGRCGGSVTINRVSGGVTLAQRELLFDHVGRVRAERELMPEGWNERQKYYKTTGWAETVRTIVQKDHGNPWGTVFDAYDPFGRAHTVTGADGRMTTLNYVGDRFLSRLSNDGSIDVEEKRDSLGRLVAIGERSDSSDPSARIATTYTYDVNDRLASVTTVGGQPSRMFTYDGRGFLVTERSPEIGLNGNGTVYRTFDSAGHALTEGFVQPGQPPTAFDLAFDHDRAERLTTVTQRTTSHVLKQYTYYRDNNNPQHPGSSAGLAIGKVYQAVRHNWVPNPDNPNPLDAVADVDIPATQTFFYLGPHGLVSLRRTSVSGGHPAAGESLFYDDLGNVTSISYPGCSGPCAGVAPARTVRFDYHNGRIVNIPGFADTGAGGGEAIKYHWNGTLKSVRHLNGVSDAWGEDPHHMIRPASIQAGGLWSSGTYLYDAAGDITDMIGGSHADHFIYDRARRVTSATVGGRSQSYTYDHYGNLLSIGSRTNSADVQSNRLLCGSCYDLAGNLKSLNGYAYTYDALSKVRSLDGGTIGKEFIYTADEERIGVINYKSGEQLWSFRGAGNEVLRDYSYEKSGSTFAWKWKDYVYRGDALVAAVSPSGSVHYHADHLGTPRATSDSGGALLKLHSYFPFGEELTPDQDAERLKFTGHERDNNNTSPAGQTGDLDYMHERYYDFLAGRFLSVDTAGGSTEQPQRWNRYSYATNNPLTLVDRNGLAPDKTTVVATSVAAGSLLSKEGVTTGLSQAAKVVFSRKVVMGGFENVNQFLVENPGFFRASAAVYNKTVQGLINAGNFVRGFTGQATKFLPGGETTAAELAADTSGRAVGATVSQVAKVVGSLPIQTAMVFFAMEGTEGEGASFYGPGTPYKTKYDYDLAVGNVPCMAPGVSPQQNGGPSSGQ